MSPDLLSAFCSVLVVLLAGSEAFPLTKRIKANSWGQLLIAVVRAIGSQKRKA
jgi:hypothetical protein